MARYESRLANRARTGRPESACGSSRLVHVSGHVTSATAVSATLITARSSELRLARAVNRRQARPSGTEGGRKQPTRTPCSAQIAAARERGMRRAEHDGDDRPAGFAGLQAENRRPRRPAPWPCSWHGRQLGLATQDIQRGECRRHAGGGQPGVEDERRGRCRPGSRSPRARRGPLRPASPATWTV